MSGRRGIGGGGKIQVVSGEQYVADTARLTMKYTDQTLYVAGSTGGALMNVAYTMNDPTQCNKTTSSGVPQGWAAYSGMFDKFVVLGSKIHWRIRNLQPGGSFGASGNLGANPTNSCMYSFVLVPFASNDAGPSSVAAAAVAKYASKRYDFPRNRNGDGGSGYPEPTQQNPAEVWKGSHSMSVSKIEGEPNLRQSVYEGFVGAGPPSLATPCYWQFYLQDILAGVAAKGVFLFQVEVWYDILFFDRKTVSDTFLGLPRPALTSVVSPVPPSSSSHEEKKTEHGAPVMASKGGVAVASLQTSPTWPLDASSSPLRAPSGYVLVKQP